MLELENVVAKVKSNQYDLYNQLVEVEKVVRQNEIKNIFLNYTNEGFLAKYLLLPINKLTFNSYDFKHFSEYGNFENCTFVSHKLETINIQDYDLMHFDCTHNFKDWESYLKRILRLNPKYIILSNTRINQLETIKIVKGVFHKTYDIQSVMDGYNGLMIFKKR